MATTIDELIIKIGADIADMKKGLSEAQKITKSSSNNMESSLGTLKTAFGALGIAFTVSEMVSFGKESLKFAADIGDASERIGITTKSLQELRFGAQQSGVSFQELDQSMLKFTQVIGDAAGGSESAQKVFKKLELSIHDANGNIKTTDILMREASNKISQYGSAAERASLLTDLFGKSGARLGPLLGEGTGALDKFSKQANDSGAIIEEQLIKKAKRFDDGLVALMNTMKAHTATTIIQFGDAMKGIFTKPQTIEDMRSRIDSLTKSLERGGSGGSGFLKGFSGIDAKKKELEALKIQLDDLMKAERLAENARAEGGKTKRLGPSSEDIADAEKKRLEADEKEIMDLQAKNETMIALDDEKYASQIAKNKAAIETIKGEHKGKVDFAIEQEKKQKDFEEKTQAMKLEATSKFLGGTAAAFKSFGGEWFATAKRLAQAQAIIDAYAAFNRSLATYPAPWGAIAGAGALASGLANVRNIESQGFNQGGTVPGIGVRDSVPAMLTPGEEVVNKDTAGMLRNFLSGQGGGGGSTRVHITFSPPGFKDMVENVLIESDAINTSSRAS